MLRLSVAASLVTALGLASAQGLYAGTSPVLQVDAKNYDSLIAQSNHTSIVEFYAPWCGHCKNLKPQYEKAAKTLAGLAKVAAVNCDEEPNKPFCAQFGVQGFPTLKIVKPGKRPGKPVVEDYQGGRTAKEIVDVVTGKIQNHVKKLQDKDLDAWLEQSTGPKAILFTEKGTTSALIKALAIDYLGAIDFAQIRSKETDAVSKFDVDSFPTIVLINNGEPIKYDGEVKKASIVTFLNQAASPNPDPAPRKAKPSSTKRAKSASASSAFSKASAAHKSSDFEDYIEHASTIVLGDDMPTESPLPIVDQEKPVVVEEVVPPVPILSTAAELELACLSPKSGHCILILLPQQADPDTLLPEMAIQALTSFAEIANKHHKRRDNIFPFYAIPADNEDSAVLRQSLELSDHGLDVVAVNVKRGYWRQYSTDQYSSANVEAFVDAIRLGEGGKKKLPLDFFVVSEPTAQSEEQETVTEPDFESETQPESEQALPHEHDEL